MSNKKSLPKRATVFVGKYLLGTVHLILFLIGYAYGSLMRLIDVAGKTVINAATYGRGVSRQERAKKKAEEAAAAASKALVHQKMREQSTGVSLAKAGIDIEKCTANILVKELLNQFNKSNDQHERMGAMNMLGFLFEVVTKENKGHFVRITKREVVTENGNFIEITPYFMYVTKKQEVRPVMALSRGMIPADTELAKSWSNDSIVTEHESWQGMRGLSGRTEGVVADYLHAVEKVKSMNPQWKHTYETIDMGFDNTDKFLRNTITFNYFMSDQPFDFNRDVKPKVVATIHYNHQPVPFK